jgi:para-nitrobenzyl esterase
MSFWHLGATAVVTATASNSTIEVSTADGILRGVVRNETQLFLGVSYAHAERWNPPQAAQNWSGIRDATQYGPVCIDGGNNGASSVGQEDCLSLDIYAPLIGPSAGSPLYPVIVFFHGGCFISGSNSQSSGDWDSGTGDGSYFVQTRRDVIIVSPQFRKSVFGYLAVDALRERDPGGSTGNYGLMDQREALR